MKNTLICRSSPWLSPYRCPPRRPWPEARTLSTASAPRNELGCIDGWQPLHLEPRAGWHIWVARYLKGSSKDTAASAVVFLGSTDLEYGAVALGNIAGGNNAFVKIQAATGAGTFDHGAFYVGNNGSGVYFAPLPSLAILDVFFCGTTATMRITSAAGVQIYANNYGTTFGPGGGLGTYGSVGLDNYVWLRERL
jgi:hypothetical protein